jgi:probable HAF family extracellular repeat protein
MKTQKILDFHTPSALMISSGSHAPLFGRYASYVGYKIWIRSLAGKAGHMLIAILLAASCGSTRAQTSPTAQYQVTYLDSLGGTNSRGNSINNRGWIAGFSLLSGDQSRHATLWRNGSILDLGTLGGPDKNSSVTWPVKNNRGIIAGISQTDLPEPNRERWSCFAFFSGPNREGYTCLGFVWMNGVMRELPPLPGGNNSFATGADNKGQVVGWAENDVRDRTCVERQVLQFRPVIWGPGTHQIQELPLISGDTSGAATAINNKGQIVGISGSCDQAVGRYTAKHAVLWEKGEAIKIGNLGVELWNTPMSINQRGDIVGFAGTDPNDLAGDFLRAFIWTRKSGIKRLEPLPLSDHVFSQANAINERGQVVGISCTVGGDCRAILWENHTRKNLNDLIAPGFNGILLNAQDINDQGEITGRAFDPATGRLRAYVAVPVSAHRSEIGKVAASSAWRAKVVLPEDVKQTLRQQRGLVNANLLR